MNSAIESNTGKPVVVLDDGRYYIELNPNYIASQAPGFLQVRRQAGTENVDESTTCVGSFDRKADETWEASVHVPYDDATDSDSMLLGQFDRRMDALVHLWKGRHQAVLPPDY